MFLQLAVKLFCRNLNQDGSRNRLYSCSPYVHAPNTVRLAAASHKRATVNHLTLPRPSVQLGDRPIAMALVARVDATQRVRRRTEGEAYR